MAWQYDLVLPISVGFLIFSGSPVSAQTTNGLDKPLPHHSAVSLYKDKDGLAPANRWFVGIGGGWMGFYRTNATNYAYSGMPGFPDDRYVNNGSDNGGQISGFVGYQWKRDALWFPATNLSFEYTYTPPTNIRGVIYVNNLPDAKNFTYKYDISQQVPMAKLKLDLYQWNQFMPYVAAGLGVALNHSTNFSASPIPGATVMDRRFGFNSVTTKHFAGTLGLGFDYSINNTSQISLGYEWAYYGKARTGYGQGSLSNNYLESNLNSNALIVKGTYFFN